MVMTLLPHYETADVRIEKIVVGPFENNVFVLRSKGTGDAVIIDAANEHELLLDVSQRTGVRRVLTTHGHFDHIQAVTQMRDAGIDVGIAADDATMLPSYDFVIPDDDVIEVGDLRLRTIHTPGSHAGLHVLPARGTPDRVQRRHAVPRRPGQHRVRERRASTRSSSRSTAACSRCRPTRSCSPATASTRRSRASRRISTSGSRAAGRRVTTARNRTAALSLDGDDVYFETVGAADAPVVVLGHGAGGNHAIWFQQVPAFATRVPRRHLGPARLRHFDEPQRASRTRAPRRATCSRSSTTSASTARTSSASRWAAGPRWASRVAHPDRVRSLVLADTLGRHRDRRLVERRGGDRAARRAVQPSRAVERLLPPQSGARAPLPADRRAPPRSARRSDAADAARLRRRDASPTSSSPRWRCPTLFIVGTHDEIFPPASIAAAAARVPGATGRAGRGRGAFALFRAARQPGMPWSGLLVSAVVMR